MKKTDTPTKGDRVDQYVKGVADCLKSGLEHFQKHPDEAVVLVGPSLVLAVALRRHRLSWTDQILISQAGYWLGVLLDEKYRAWKAEPVSSTPLKKVA